jgi:hypothetical protein
MIGDGSAADRLAEGREESEKALTQIRETPGFSLASMHDTELASDEKWPSIRNRRTGGTDAIIYFRNIHHSTFLFHKITSPICLHTGEISSAFTMAANLGPSESSQEHGEMITPLCTWRRPLARPHPAW